MGSVFPNRRMIAALWCGVLLLGAVVPAMAQVPSGDARIPSPRVPLPTWTQPRAPDKVNLEQCWEKSGVVYRTNATGIIIEQKTQVDCTFADWENKAFVKWVCQAAPAGSKTKYEFFAQSKVCTGGALCASDACQAVKPNTCWMLDGYVLATDAKGKIVDKKKIAQCDFPDLTSAAYQTWACSTDKKKMKGQAKSCPDGNLCVAGTCQPAPPICEDADYDGVTPLFVPPVGSALPSPTIPADQPQIKSASYLTIQQGQNPAKVMADGCKGIALREMVCTGTGVGFAEASVKCPDDYICKTKATAGPDGNLLKGKDGKPALVGYCGLTCSFGDACPSEPGCGECTQSMLPDPCTPLDITKTYPNATIAKTVPPHLDTCFDTDTVQHNLCENGKADYPTTDCAPGKLCKNGLCGGAPASEEFPDAPKACVDLDPPPSQTNSPPGQAKDAGTNGGIHTFGQISLNGSVDPAANDSCISECSKILNQATCSGTTYQVNQDTCFFALDGKPEKCKGGVCQPITQPCACQITPPDLATKTPGKTAGIDQFGDSFNIGDECVPSDPHLIKKASCGASCLCFDGPDTVTCPAGMICKDNLCQSENSATCAGPSSADANSKFEKMTVSGVDQAGVAFTDVPDECAGNNSQVKQVWCDVAKVQAYVKGPAEDCVLSLCNSLPDPETCQQTLCADGACVKCVDSDPQNLVDTVGYGADLDASHSDICNTEKKLVQVTCKDGVLIYETPIPCPTGSCDQGQCIEPTDQCAGKDLTSTDKCQIGSCNPLTGAVTFTPKSILDDGNACTKDGCDASTGFPTHIEDKSLPGCDLCAGKDIIPPDQCQTGACNPLTGAVTFTPEPIEDDGDACTKDGCEPNTGAATHVKDTALPGCGEVGPAPALQCDDGSVALWSPLGIKDPYGHLHEQSQSLRKVVSLNPSTHFAMSKPVGSGIGQFSDMFRYSSGTKAWSSYKPVLSKALSPNTITDMVAVDDSLWFSALAYTPSGGEVTGTYIVQFDGVSLSEQSQFFLSDVAVTDLFASQGSLYAVSNVAGGIPSIHRLNTPATQWHMITGYNAPALVTQIINHADDTYLFAGNGTVWSTTGADLQWLQQGSIPGEVTAAVSYQNTLYAGTSSGTVWHSDDSGSTWSLLSMEVTITGSIDSLVEHKGMLYLGASSGIYQWSGNGTAWGTLDPQFMKCSGTDGLVTVQLSSDGSQLLARTQCDGVHRYGCPVQAVAQCPEGQILKFDPLGMGDPYGNLANGGHHPFAMPYAIRTNVPPGDAKFFRYAGVVQNSWIPYPINGLGDVYSYVVTPKEVVTIGNVVYVQADIVNKPSRLIRSTSSGQTWQMVLESPWHNLTAFKYRILGINSVEKTVRVLDVNLVSNPWKEQFLGDIPAALHVSGTQAFAVTATGGLFELFVDNILNEASPQFLLLGTPTFAFTKSPTALYRHQGQFFVATAGAGVWRSPDGGETWQEANQGLPSQYGYAFAEYQGVLHLGVAKALYRWNVETLTWELVHQLAVADKGEFEYLQADAKALYAGVHGAGMYQLHCAGCGDSVLGTDEQCDGWNTQMANCQNLVGLFYTGFVKCTAQCAFDVSSCTKPASDYSPPIPATLQLPVCGNWKLDAGEVCDTKQLATKAKTDGAFCKASGYFGGTALCKNDCSGYEVETCFGWGDQEYGTPPK